MQKLMRMLKVVFVVVALVSFAVNASFLPKMTSGGIARYSGVVRVGAEFFDAVEISTLTPAGWKREVSACGLVKWDNFVAGLALFNEAGRISGGMAVQYVPWETNPNGKGGNHRPRR